LFFLNKEDLNKVSTIKKKKTCNDDDHGLGNNIGYGRFGVDDHN